MVTAKSGYKKKNNNIDNIASGIYSIDTALFIVRDAEKLRELQKNQIHHCQGKIIFDSTPPPPKN